MFGKQPQEMNEYEVKAFDIARKIRAQEKIASDFTQLYWTSLKLEPAIHEIRKNETLKDVLISDDVLGSVLLVKALARIERIIEEVVEQRKEIESRFTPKEELTLSDVLMYIEGFNAAIREEGAKLPTESDQRITFPCREVEMYMRNCGYIVKPNLEYTLKEHCPLVQLSLYGMVKGKEEKQNDEQPAR